MKFILVNVLTDYPLPFYSDSGKKVKGALTPDLTQGVAGLTPPPTAPSLPLCYDHPYSDPASVSSGDKSSGQGGSCEGQGGSYEGQIGSYEEHYSAPASGRGEGSITSASEHHYDVPHICLPDPDSPQPSEASHLLLPPERGQEGGSRGTLDSNASLLEKPPRSESPASTTASDATSSKLTHTIWFGSHFFCAKRGRIIVISY